jgi:hypothetical protein
MKTMLVVKSVGDLSESQDTSPPARCALNTHLTDAGGEAEDGAGQVPSDTQTGTARTYSLLNVYAQTYESAQRLRIDQMNRLRCWLRDTLPRDQWGDTDLSDKALKDEKLYRLLPNDQRLFVDVIRGMEASAERYMSEDVRQQPLWPWFERQRGIAEVLAARLLHRLGDLGQFPSPAHLWSYCGLDGPDWRRKTEEGKLTYSRVLNKLAWQCAKSFSMQPRDASGYREVYDRRKAYEQTKGWCGKCRPKGEAADAPRDLCIPAHIDNRAKRFTAKRFLLDLWVEAEKVRSNA